MRNYSSLPIITCKSLFDHSSSTFPSKSAFVSLPPDRKHLHTQSLRPVVEIVLSNKHQRFAANELNSKENIIELIKVLESHFEITNKEQWNWKVTLKQLMGTKAGRSLLRKYNFNLQTALREAYPSFDWDPNLKTKLPQGYWKSKENQRAYIEKVLLKRLNLKTKNDLQCSSMREILKVGGGSLLKIYKNSVYSMLSTLYPAEHWNPFDFRSLPQHYWSSLQNQRNFLEELSQKLGFDTWKCWYSINSEIIARNGGGGLMNLYHFNIFKMLQTLYPEYPWNIEESSSRKSRYILLYPSVLLSLQHQFGIRRVEDWYRISLVQLSHSSNFSAAITYAGGLYSVLKHHHPDVHWVKSKFSEKSKKSSQRWLLFTLSQLFPQYYAFEEYCSPLLLFSNGANMEFDVIIPSLGMGFEYQGVQHYDELPSLFPPTFTYSSRDSEKADLCKSHNITLIHIPYWWNNNLSSLCSFFPSHLQAQFCKL